MPRFNVQLPDGRWRVFSTVVDGFVTDPMSYKELRKYRRKQAIAQADRETRSLLGDRPMVNRMTYEEAMAAIASRESDD